MRKCALILGLGLLLCLLAGNSALIRSALSAQVDVARRKVPMASALTRSPLLVPEGAGGVSSEKVIRKESEPAPSYHEFQGEDERPVERALASGKICEVENALAAAGPKPMVMLGLLGEAQPLSLPRDVVFAFVEAFSEPDARGVLRALEGKPEPLLRYFRALLLADMVEGYPNPGMLDFRAAHRELEGLAAEDPDNGIYPWMAAGVLAKSGAGTEETQAAFRRAFARPKFEDLALPLLRSFLELAIAEPVRAPLLLRLYSNAPAPKWLVPNAAMKAALKEGDPAFHSAAGAWGRKILAQIEPWASLPGDFFWIPTLYQVAWSVRHDSALALGLASPVEGLKPRAKEAFERSREKMNLAFEEALPEKGVCREEKVRAMIAGLKENYAAYEKRKK